MLLGVSRSLFLSLLLSILQGKSKQHTYCPPLPHKSPHFTCIKGGEGTFVPVVMPVFIGPILHVCVCQSFNFQKTSYYIVTRPLLTAMEM